MVAQIVHHTPYPIHPSVKDRLHPDYVAFYNKYLINQQPAHLQPIAVSRRGGSVVVCNSDPLPVGKSEDICIPRQESAGPEVSIRYFTPQGDPPGSGWPAVLYVHGGGWVFGDIDTENNVCTNMTVRSKCVVITTDYRLAPENPWPAAIHDTWEAFLWTVSQGAKLLNLDLGKMAVAGASAGANIAAVIVQNATLRPQPGVSICSQLLVVPITDNTANTYSNPTWKAFEFTAGLSAKKMLWYRQHYLPCQANWTHREASPLLASDEVFSRLPPANIIVGELDVLRHDGEEYARKLEANGVSAVVTVMEGMPHPFLAMDAVLDAGKRAITIMCEDLVRAFA
ncbi:triacylglycerol lipase [Capronia coronata CBS 617.96]|uniref:Triacylglycerol lipase n=1 Tax=Capronia coronata CBS 617.96 TaxID=1182541 RepID=W9YNU6_9EURO|nr:triacylglycerol lipase [Capronia coronata CBS 617.96]EXJ94238.1 triacylglycerol lipase [Capronia coronata CBS 617.96]